MVGAVLAGGTGSRMGGRKAARALAGRPLIAYPLAAVSAVCERVAVVAKPDSELPALGTAERWDEPAAPAHPLTGIVHALQRAEGAVLVCAADMPFVTAAACRALIDARRADGAVAEADGVTQPVFAVYELSALEALHAARPDAALREVVDRLEMVRVESPATLVRSINTPEQLADAERMLESAP